jgi:hypothetical protein
MLVLVFGCAVLFPPGRSAVSVLALLPEFFPGLPVRPLELVTPAPKRSLIELQHNGQMSVADLYDPGTPGPHGAVVLFLGVDPAGRDDPRVVRLGEGLARIGIMTLIPQSQDMLNSKVDPGEIEEIVAAFQYLATRPDVDPKRVGLGGFCIGASIALDAAEDPRINNQVALVNSFTGYFDLPSYIVSIVTHTVQPVPSTPGAEPETWEPAANATTILADHLISLDPNLAEAAVLRASAHDSAVPPDPANLSPIGQTIAALPTTRDPAQADRLVANLPSDAQTTLRRLSPGSHLDELHAKVFIMHDHDDSSVPYVQSRMLAASLRPGQGEYDEFHFFAHVDPTAAVSPRVFVEDTARLASHMFRIVEILQGAVRAERY